MSEKETRIAAAWALVAAECPSKKSAALHRAPGSPLVHVAPLGHPEDVRCVAGEEVAEYPGLYRPVGGYADASLRHGHDDEKGQSWRGRAAKKSRDRGVLDKTRPYLLAEMTGR